MINREQIHRTLLEIYFLSFMYTLVPCSYYFSEDKYLSLKLSTLWFVFGSVKEPKESLCLCVCLSVCLSVRPAQSALKH